MLSESADLLRFPEEEELLLLLLLCEEEVPADCLEEEELVALCPPVEAGEELLLDTEVEAWEDWRDELPLPMVAVLLLLLWLSEEVDCLVPVPSLRVALPVRLPWLTVEDDCLVVVPWLRVAVPVWLLLPVEEELLVVVPDSDAGLPVLLLRVAVLVDWRVVPAVPVLLCVDLLVAVPDAVLVLVPA